MNTIDAEQQSPLFRACERGHTEVMVTLLQAGADVNLADSGGRSPLHWYSVCVRVYVHVCEWIRVNIRKKGGWSQLHYVCHTIGQHQGVIVTCARHLFNKEFRLMPLTRKGELMP